MNSQNKLFFVSFFLTSSIYFLGNLMYFEVNPLVNYMWKLDLDFSIKYLIINYFFLSMLIISLSKMEIIERHFFLIIIIGVFMPMSIISNHTSTSIIGCFFTFINILFTNFLYRIVKSIFRNDIVINFTNHKFFTVDRFLYGINFVSVLLFGYLILSNFDLLTSFNVLSTLEKVYDIREENTLTGFVSYFPGWIMGVCVPILLSSFLIKKNYFSLIFTFFGVFLMFQLFAMKVQILSLVMLCLFGFLYKYTLFLKNFAVEIFYITVFVASYILRDLMYVFLDRFFYLTGQLNLHYFEFYNTHPKNYFNGSKLGVFFSESIYKKPMGYVIDEYFYGGGMNANTGYIASSFGELGYWGYLLTIVIISILLYAIIVFYHKSSVIAYLISIQIAFSLINSPLTDIFLTNGVLIVFFISFALKPNIKLI